MKLSEIGYKDIFFKCNDDDLEKIVFEENAELRKCKIGIVFGGIAMIPYRADMAIQLYKTGMIEQILITGGIGYLNKNRKITEATMMYEHLIESGIPNADILIEDKSRSSYQNVLYTYNLLKNNCNLEKDNIVLITSDFHIRRCREMFSMLLENDSNLYSCGVKDEKTDVDNWKKSLYGKLVVLKEALLLCYYAKTTKIKDNDIKSLTLKKTHKNL